MTLDIHATASTRLRADGQRYTPRRRALVELLVEADQPLTIPQLLEHRRDLAQSSAYRNLAVLERAGVVHRIVTTDEFSRYELAEDLTEHHHHLICSSCGGVADFTVPAKVEEELESALAKVAKRTGFRTRGHRLDLVGTCASCAVSSGAWAVVVVAGGAAAAVLGALLTLPLWRDGGVGRRPVVALLALHAGAALVIGMVLAGAAVQSWSRAGDEEHAASTALLDISHADGDAELYALLLVFVAITTVAVTAVLAAAARCAARPDTASRAVACAVLGLEIGLGGVALARVVGGSRGALYLVALAHLPFVIAAMVATWPAHHVPLLRDER